MSATAQKFEITSSPVAALMGATLLVGAERDAANDLKLYVGARYRGIYVVIPEGEMADRMEAAWRGSSCHLYMRPVPSDEMLFCDREAEPRP